jgi:GNAT superfamily N-acetyltransferase
MAATDHGTAVQLGPLDVLAGLALSDEAHWNQTADDWRFFLTHGTVLGIRDKEGRVVATAALLPYTANAAWISMVLVTADWRRRGLATGLLDDCLTLAKSRGMVTWLDATPAGARVYGPMGFTPTLQLQRLAHVPAKWDPVRRQGYAPTRESTALSGDIGSPGDPGSAVGVEGSGLGSTAPTDPATPSAFDELLARDARAMGFDRSALLDELRARPGSRLVSREGALGLVRSGRKARHIGPLFADRPDQALALVEDIVRTETGPLLIDAADRQDGFLAGLTGAGWIIERPFQRMRFGLAAGKAPVPPMAGVGPEFG